MSLDTGQGRGGSHGDAVAYVLGALDAAARERFEAHAATCPECLQELQELGPVVDGLALGVAQVDPPVALERRLLARAQELMPPLPPLPALPEAVAGRPLPARPVPIGAPPGLPPSPQSAEGTRAAGSAPSPAPRRHWWQMTERFGTSLAGCALVVALFSGGLAVTERLELQRANETTAVLAETLSIMYQPGRFSRELSGDYGNPQAKGMVYLTPDGTDAVLVAYNLPKLVGREIYQVWLNNPEAEQRVNVGTFKVDDKGRGHAIVRSPYRMSQFKYCGVTKEQQATAKPSGPRVLNGSLAQ